MLQSKNKEYSFLPKARPLRDTNAQHCATLLTYKQTEELFGPMLGANRILEIMKPGGELP